MIGVVYRSLLQQICQEKSIYKSKHMYWWVTLNPIMFKSKLDFIQSVVKTTSLFLICLSARLIGKLVSSKPFFELCSKLFRYFQMSCFDTHEWGCASLAANEKTSVRRIQDPFCLKKKKQNNVQKSLYSSQKATWTLKWPSKLVVIRIATKTYLCQMTETKELFRRGQNKERSSQN